MAALINSLRRLLTPFRQPLILSDAPADEFAHQPGISYQVSQP